MGIEQGFPHEAGCPKLQPVLDLASPAFARVEALPQACLKAMNLLICEALEGATGSASTSSATSTTSAASSMAPTLPPLLHPQTHDDIIQNPNLIAFFYIGSGWEELTPSMKGVSQLQKLLPLSVVYDKMTKVQLQLWTSLDSSNAPDPPHNVPGQAHAGRAPDPAPERPRERDVQRLAEGRRAGPHKYK
eukprot:3116692-Amphidinium_carterae.1